ncbi:MAG TPA: YciI family protein [Candidatus Limnocylindria bacterium]|nr:YciI family protein [Candidatus Limnocylindria bacterium]
MSAPTPKSEYMLFFRGPHWDRGLSAEELQQVMAQVMAWFEGLKHQGKVKAGQPLGAEGKHVSGKKGRTIADGPFAESKEAVGGYLLVEAENLDEAVAIAKSNPTLEYGVTIEVRPVLEECPIFDRARKRLLSDAMA